MLNLQLRKSFGRKENNGIYLSKDGYLIKKFEKPTERLNLKQRNYSLIANIPNIKKIYMLVLLQLKS